MLSHVFPLWGFPGLGLLSSPCLFLIACACLVFCAQPSVLWVFYLKQVTVWHIFRSTQCFGKRWKCIQTYTCIFLMYLLDHRPLLWFFFRVLSKGTVESALTCTGLTRGMAWAARHLFKMEKGSIGAFRNTGHTCQTGNPQNTKTLQHFY